MEKIIVLPFLLIIGAVVGPEMFLSHPSFSLSSKIIYCFVLLGSLAAIFLGIRKRKIWIGKGAILVGVVAWLAAGLIGLGTGT